MRVLFVCFVVLCVIDDGVCHAQTHVVSRHL